MSYNLGHQNTLTKDSREFVADPPWASHHATIDISWYWAKLDATGVLKLTFCDQLEMIKKEQGPSVESGSVARDKTLAAILAENKAKKEEQFQSMWKGMKQGVSNHQFLWIPEHALDFRDLSL